MRGVIGCSEVLRYALTIIRLWGPRAYVRCLRAAMSRKRTTFLEVVWT